VLTDSVQSGIERALIITEQLQAEVSKGEHFSGLINILNIDAKAIEARFQSLLKKTEEYLFIVAETKLRQTNFYAWLYKSYKKYEVKIEEPADPAEKKVDDSILKNYTVDKLTLLKFLNSEDSFNMRYLYQFFSPQAEDLELEQYNFEYKNQAPRLNELEANVNEEIEAVVRKQTLDMALSSINRFALETFGVAMEQAKIPMREEKINESRGNFKSLLKGINEAILAAKTQFSECLNSNIKLEKSVKTQLNSDRPWFICLQERLPYFFLPRTRKQ
jgi:hypothetical protein